MTTTNWKNKVFFGKRKEDNANIYLSAPTWDCGWYWGFGYLGNKNEHYHLSSYKQKTHCLTDDKGKFHLITESRNKNMYDCLKEDYELNPNILHHLWQFCELVSSAYSLKETAEILGRGGSHFTTNVCKDIITNSDEVKRINGAVLPSIFNAIHEILNSDVESLYISIAETYESGNLSSVVDLMLKNKMHTDQLEHIKGLDKDAISKIHTAYWRKYHNK